MLKAQIRSVILKYKQSLCFIVILGFCWPIRDILTPYLIKMIIDGAMSLDSVGMEHFLLKQLALILAVWIAMEICMRFQGWLLYKTILPIRSEICTQIMTYIKQCPYGFFLNKSSGNLSDKIQGITYGCESLLSICLLSFFPILAHLAFCLVLTTFISLAFTSLFFGWMVLHLGITYQMGKKSLKKIEQEAEIKSDLNGKIVDALMNIFVVKTYCREQYEQQYLANFQKRELDAALVSRKYLERIRLALGIGSISMLAATIGFSFLGWKRGNLTMGDLTLMMVLLLNLTSYLWYISMEFIRFNEQFGRIKENLESLMTEPEEKGATDSPLLSIGRISLQNVSYAFDQPVFTKLNLSVDPGKKVAIMGLSGSGKTTLINLLLSHLALQSGDIKIGQTSITKLPLKTLREYFAIVPQNPSLFHRTVKENIQYGNFYASEDRLIEAAKIANCHDFILKLSHGYDTVVGERGNKLSGGQRQRIAIARALIKPSPVLILDEPTAGLDRVTAMQTMQNVIQASSNRTLIVITHSDDVATLMNEVIKLK